MGVFLPDMSIPTRIIKAHATGNDFVAYVDADGEYEPSAEQTAWLCDRHRAVGADGLLRITHPQYVSDLTGGQREALGRAGSEWFMDYRNADGSLAEMCGNGTRVVALLVRRFGLVEPNVPLALGTRAGVKRLEFLGDDPLLGSDVFRVDMGPWHRGEFGEYRVRVPGTTGSAPGTFVDVGNPHVVSVMETAGAVPHVPADGGEREKTDGHQDVATSLAWNTVEQQTRAADLPCLKHLDLLRKPVVEPVLASDQNVEFVRVDAMDAARGQGAATMRVHERGVGETLSCGTGLCASGIVLQGLTGVPHWNISVPGGTLRVDVSPQSVWLTGSATLVANVELLDSGTCSHE